MKIEIEPEERETTAGDPAQAAIECEQAVEAEIDRELEDTFPASDPPGWVLGVDLDGVYSPSTHRND